MNPCHRSLPDLPRTVLALALAIATGSAAANDVPSAPARLDMGSCRVPEYPPESARANETGTTTLQFRVSAEGQSSHGEVIESSGHPRLDQAALESLSQCRFKPALDTGGRAMAVRTKVQYVWKIADAPDPWQDIRIDASRFPETPDVLAVPQTGVSAFDPRLQQRVLSDLARLAAARVGCRSIEAVDIRPAPERLRVQLGGMGPAPTSEAQELWTLQQCGATIGHIVALREYGHRLGAYQLIPLRLPQLNALSAVAPVEVTEQQVRAEYEHVVRTFGREYQVRHILVGLATAQLALERLRAAEPFEVVARDLSTDPASRLKGGQLGWNIPSNFVDQFAAAMVQLAPRGLATRPVQTRFGWHVIELLAVREQALPRYEQVKDQIAADLRKRALATTGR